MALRMEEKAITSFHDSGRHMPLAPVWAGEADERVGQGLRCQEDASNGCGRSRDADAQ